MYSLQPTVRRTSRMSKLNKSFQELLKDHWAFLDSPWPERQLTRNHRTMNKDVPRMSFVKTLLLERLGAIPVFFFLINIWALHEYPGPYREVDKGILFLYHLVKGVPMDGISPYIPKSSFHVIHTHFYKQEYNMHSKKITSWLASMFSSITIRLLSAKAKNPPLFRHVTLHLDGHDTRATYGESSAEMYSYKLKKSGLRTQVCMDVNGMAILVSRSQSCKDHNDGTMLVDMKVYNHIHELDCIALDGGYTQHIPNILDKCDLTKDNFCCPVRKKRHQDLAESESNYNSMFGSFRSQMESLFGELGRTFEKHNNRNPVLVDKKRTYNLQLRLCLLLLNIKHMVALLSITEEPIHLAWMRDNFEYPYKDKSMEYQIESVPVETMLESATSMAKLQEEFLNMSMTDVETEQKTSHKREIMVAVEIPRKK